MQILRTLLVVAAAGLQLFRAPNRSDPLLVRAVVDGNTIDIAGIGRVRLLGIDAPKIGRRQDTAAPFAHEAKDRLGALVLHRYVRLEHDAVRPTIADRHRAYVLLEDGQLVNAVMVRDGFARVTTRVPLSKLAELQRAESEAKAFRRGMWGAAPRIPPSPGYTRPTGPEKIPMVRVKKPRSPRSSGPKKPKKVS
jgi:endonuclease YncB( thermonuclease family)